MGDASAAGPKQEAAVMDHALDAVGIGVCAAIRLAPPPTATFHEQRATGVRS